MNQERVEEQKQQLLKYTEVGEQNLPRPGLLAQTLLQNFLINH